jgi:hypothetical protein
MQTMYFYPCSEEYPLSQQFGENPAMYRQFGLAGHNGLDIALLVGQPVYAAADGEVVLAEAQGTTSYGRQIRLQHKEALSLYAHLSRLQVQQGEQVQARQLIGFSGGAVSDPHAGNSTGPHLHFELRLAAGGVPGYNGAVNPLPLLCSHDHDPVAVPIYQVQVVVQALNLRTRPDTGSRIAETAGLGAEFSILKELEKDGMLWLRVQAPLRRYLCARQGSQTYARRLLTYTSRPLAENWADSVTAFLRSIGYTGPAPQQEH